MSQPDIFHSFTKTPHKHTYPALSPTLPAHSAEGKTILISGASQGIGLEIAKTFAVAKATNLVLLARSKDALAEAKAGIEKEHATKVYTYVADISDHTLIAKLISQIREEVADPDVLVLSAGILHKQMRVFDLSIEDLQKSLEINCTSNFALVKSFLEKHIEAPDGKQKVIVNLSSVVAHQNFPGMSAYGAGKVALMSMLGHVHDEYADRGVSVRSFHPGSIYTSLLVNHGMAKDFWPWDDSKCDTCLAWNPLTY